MLFRLVNRQSLMRLLYTLIFYLALPLVLVRLFIRSFKAPAYRRHWAERFGVLPFTIPKKSIWIHAVSFGESVAATPLIEHLLQKHPATPIVITNTTPTGRGYIRKKFEGRLKNAYFPYDTPVTLKRFYRHANPMCLVIIETELWPNLLRFCHQHDVKTILANARLSERSAKGYARWPKLVTPMMHELSFVAAQDKAGGQRFVALGLAPEKLVVTGSIKFDLPIPEDIDQKAAVLKQILGKRPIWIAASTHEGEEKHILAAHQLIRKQCPNALLLWVPRHPERFEPVKTLCEKASLGVITRSNGKPCTKDTAVFVGDTMGEMLLFYAAAQIAFIGGSLIPIGGHNMLEAAALEVPVLTGPNVQNFTQIAKQLKEARALKVVQNSKALATEVITLFEDESQRTAMGQAGATIVAENRGALKRLCALVDQVIPSECR